MAMDPDVLGPKITEAFSELGAAIREGREPPGSSELWRKVAAAIIEHIQQHAVVAVTPDGTPAMAAGGDPVTGKGKGVIS